jgi:CRP-like cAMP-binding protein
MVASPHPQRDANPDNLKLRQLLESSFQNHNLVSMSAGSPVPLLKGHVWLVVRGMTKLVTSYMSGDEALLGLVGPGEPFGEPLSEVDPYEAITLSDCDLLCLRWDELTSNPSLTSGMLLATVRRYRQAESLLALMGQRRVEERLRSFLELMARDYGQPCEQGVRISVRLTHQDLASLLGTTRVTVTRFLGQLRDQGWLAIAPSRHVVVKSVQKR